MKKEKITLELDVYRFDDSDMETSLWNDMIYEDKTLLRRGEFAIMLNSTDACFILRSSDGYISTSPMPTKVIEQIAKQQVEKEKIDFLEKISDEFDELRERLHIDYNELCNKIEDIEKICGSQPNNNNNNNNLLDIAKMVAVVQKPDLLKELNK